MAKKRDAQQTKEKIISSAMLLFAQEGLNGISVDEIAKEANINKAMIYYYFKNKSELYTITVTYLLDNIYNTIVKETEGLEKAKDKLKSFIYNFASYAKQNNHLSSLMLAELSVGGKHLPAEMFAGLKKIFALLNNILKQGIDENEFEQTMPIVIHFMITGTINLFITTQGLRKEIHNEFGNDICSECTIDNITQYIYDNIYKMIKKGKEC